MPCLGEIQKAMYTRNDITPADMAHIKELCAELCADLPQRVARYRRRMTFFRLTFFLGLLLLMPLAVNAVHPYHVRPTMTKVGSLTAPKVMGQITFMLTAKP